MNILVIIPDRLSDLVKKGEITERYYNPGNLFEEVHILMINDDKPAKQDVQKMAGNAKLYLHNLPMGSELFRKTLAWRPWLLRRWVEPALALARKIQPRLIRCHGDYFNAYVASRIKTTLGIPYVVSLHTNIDTDDKDMIGRPAGWKEYLYQHAVETVRRIGLRRADIVLPVYESITPYIKRMKVINFKVAYNVLNENFLKRKLDYRLHDPIRVLSVGRQFREKNPENLIRAVKLLPNVHLTLIGDGPYHGYLREVARNCRIENRVTFIRGLPNDELCSRLIEYDIFAAHCDYWGIPKAVMEPLLTGLPVVINKRIGSAVPELEGDFLLLVENTIEGYYQALEKLIKDAGFREEIGRKAYMHSQGRWAPAKMEAEIVNLYKRLVPGL